MEFMKTLYLFGKSDIPAAVLPTIDGVEEDRMAKPHRPLPSGMISLESATILYYVLFTLMWVAALYTNTIPCTLTYSVAILIYNEGGLAAVPVVKNGHAQDFRDRSADALMGRKTIPLLLSQPMARWSLAALIAAWTIGLIALWQPPAVASIVFASLALRCFGGYLWSYDEKDDYTSYCWYGFWLLASNLLPIFPRLRGEIY
ncbi:hypothetical protein BDV25DRAFT_130707 [Aspergillus avenaceus]|uniref:UbiA prenyltransferase family-domain-containing protein n=1 Tax=Aspergillus avenaceus TaxID=36643 RepID=A0A5N6TRR5_ASPAV|nr:hypothetical protein BDV25DRAFT_130707 [Aspergillus avenaceus]